MVAVALDIDGVVAHITPEISLRIKEKTGRVVTDEDIVRFDIAKQFDLDEEWFVEQINDPVLYLNSKPYEDAWWAVNGWFSGGIDVYFVTGRPSSLANATLRWFDEWDIPYNEIYFGMPKGGKSDIIKSLGCKFMVDDRASEVRAMLEDDVDCFLMDRPWNQYYDGDAVRIKSLLELKI